MCIRDRYGNIPGFFHRHHFDASPHLPVSARPPNRDTQNRSIKKKLKKKGKRKRYQYAFTHAGATANRSTASSRNDSSSGDRNSTRIQEGRALLNASRGKSARHAPYWGGGRRACYVNPDLRYD